MKMEKIYPNADLKLVSKVVLYRGEDLTPDDSKRNRILYYDVELTKPVPGVELRDLALNSLVVISDAPDYPEDFYMVGRVYGPYPNDNDPVCSVAAFDWDGTEFRSAEYVPPVLEETE